MNERSQGIYFTHCWHKWNLGKRHIGKHKIFAAGVPDFNPYEVSSNLLLLKMYIEQLFTFSLGYAKEVQLFK